VPGVLGFAVRGDLTPLVQLDSPPDLNRNLMDEMVIRTSHPTVGALKTGRRFTTEAYEQVTFKPGSDGTTVVSNTFGDPVIVAGQVGRGRVVCSAFRFGETWKVDPSVGMWIRYYPKTVEGA